nr:hypothetical protein [Tanacetum cinerariifolium]
GTKLFEEYKNDWLYVWNKNIPWVDNKPWTNDDPAELGVIDQKLLLDCWRKWDDTIHICQQFRFHNGKTKWATCNSDCDGFYNGGELPGMVKIRCMTYFQDHDWRFEIIKYSFGSEEQFMGIKEQDYENDDGRTKNDACHAYGDIFCKMDEGCGIKEVFQRDVTE